MYQEQQIEMLQEVGIQVQSGGPTVQLTENLFIRRIILTDTELGISGREVR